MNLLGQLFLAPPRGPWELVDELVEEARRQTPVILVDFHGEATSEKVAMAADLDGKVTAVIGTHTHIQTNDARVTSRGTAAVTDAGMTGPHDSVIGVVTELVVKQMRTGMPVRFKTAQGDVRLEGCLIECGADGRRYTLRARAPGARRVSTARSAASVGSRSRTSHEASESNSSASSQ